MKLRQYSYMVFCLALILISVPVTELRCQSDKSKPATPPANKDKQEQGSSRLLTAKPKADSVPAKPVVVINPGPESMQLLVDSLQKQIMHLETRLESCRDNNIKFVEQIGELKSKLKTHYAVPGNEAKEITFNKNTYDCYVVDISKSDIHFYWKDDKTKQPIRSLKNLTKLVESGKKTLVFATNAGMYMPNNAPQGLFMENRTIQVQIDKKKDGFGNFYMQPNGVFLIDSSDAPHVLTTENFLLKYEKNMGKVKFATQSGPMVLTDGVINPKFVQDSDNLNIRSGVGIIDSSHVVFIISNQRVNFFDFATVFKEKFKCSSALYLDGAISRMYLPELGRMDNDGNFGPMIGISKKQ